MAFIKIDHFQDVHIIIIDSVWNNTLSHTIDLGADKDQLILPKSRVEQNAPHSCRNNNIGVVTIECNVISISNSPGWIQLTNGVPVNLKCWIQEKMGPILDDVQGALGTERKGRHFINNSIMQG